jgi:hypothetical protein
VSGPRPSKLPNFNGICSAMIPNKRTSTIIGILFILYFISGVIGLMLRDTALSSADPSGLLRAIFSESFKINISIFVDVLAAALGVGITIMLYPMMAKYYKGIAVWFLGFNIAGFAIIVVSDITLISLLTLSQEFVKTNSRDPSFFQTMANIKRDEYFAAHFMSVIISCMAFFAFYVMLLKTRLLPRFISIWGLVAAVLAWTATWLKIFNQEVSILVYLPNGLIILFLGGWLIAQGFRTHVLES